MKPIDGGSCDQMTFQRMSHIGGQRTVGMAPSSTAVNGLSRSALANLRSAANIGTARTIVPYNHHCDRVR
jgi:hypothetical protein